MAFAGIRQCHPDHASIIETVRASAAQPSRFIPPRGPFGVLDAALSPEVRVVRSEVLSVEDD